MGRATALDGGVRPSDDPAVSEDLDPREAARTKRRDRDADAPQRELMRPGMGKVFKQILDAQAKEASDAAPRPSKKRRRPG